ncbi:MAG: hypothetical protein KF752_16505 [Pirellulaceae bacterium]|nr:hypothetical protein [Pirellulaceae bacterium]
MRKSSSLLLLILLSSRFASAQEQAQPAVQPPDKPAKAAQQMSKTSDFMRLSQSEAGEPKSLDTAVAVYSDAANGVQVDLIAAVHIADAAYYQQLNQLFDQYDVLLYELVAPEGTVVAPGGGGRSANPISMMQDGMKNFLRLQSQLEKIDYNKPHFVRADMTPEQMAHKMQERGESVLTLVLSTVLESLRQQNLATGNEAAQGDAVTNDPLENPLSLVELLSNPQKAKIMLAKQFSSAGALDQAMGGSLNQLLVVDRNAEALRGLKKQIDMGRRKIGIFYGAAHLPDLEQHLLQDFGLTRQETRWLKAWDLTASESRQADEPLPLLLQLLRELE